MESDHRNKRRQGMRDPGLLARRTPDRSALEAGAWSWVLPWASSGLEDVGRKGPPFEF